MSSSIPAHGPMAGFERPVRLPPSRRPVLADPARMAPLPAGALSLLILQASPFCNLDCDYCYLPDRDASRRMPLALLDRVIAQVAGSGLAGPELSLVWHAGEPMAVPRDWYDEAFDIVARHLPPGGPVAVTHHFQTNAVLIDAAWCAFFRRHDVRVGVSIDGPAALHDAHRRTRDGRGTHHRVMQGIAQLRETGLPFHAIAVLTRDALDQPDAIFDFFAGLGARQVGFNVEEVEAAHGRSSLQADGGMPDAERALRAFWARLLDRLHDTPGRLRVREVEAVLAALRHPRYGQLAGNDQNRAGHMLNVAVNGDWCFWSPELLGVRHPVLGPVVMGNLARGALPAAGADADGPWAAWQQEIDCGVDACRARCAYFDFCLGGAPSNKLAEHGAFDGSETMACRLGQQVVIDAVLASLDAMLPAQGPTIGAPQARLRPPVLAR